MYIHKKSKFIYYLFYTVQGGQYKISDNKVQNGGVVAEKVEDG